MEHLFKLLPDKNKTEEFLVENRKNIIIFNNTSSWLILRLKNANGDKLSFPIKSATKFDSILSNDGFAWLEYAEIEKVIEVKATIS